MSATSFVRKLIFDIRSTPLWTMGARCFQPDAQRQPVKRACPFKTSHPSDSTTNIVPPKFADHYAVLEHNGSMIAMQQSTAIAAAVKVPLSLGPLFPVFALSLLKG
jgi:hypothetical protein